LATAPATNSLRFLVAVGNRLRVRVGYGAIVIGILILLSAVAPLISKDPLHIDSTATLVPPSWAHPFGTDQNGMDIFARVLYAARLDLGEALAAATLAVLIGVPLGALGALAAGWGDQALLRITESVQSFPTLLLAMGVVAAIGPGLGKLVLVIAAVNIPVYVRLTRSAVLPMRDMEFIQAARCAGLGNIAIVTRHLIPNIAHLIAAQFSINCAWAIQILAALSFIGLGVALPTPEWGAMVRAGADYTVYGQWWVALFPGLAIVITVLSLNELADSFRRHTSR